MSRDLRFYFGLPKNSSGKPHPPDGPAYDFPQQKLSLLGVTRCANVRWGTAKSPASVGKTSDGGWRVTASHTSRAMKVNLYAGRLMAKPSHSKVSPEGARGEAGFELEPLVPFVSHWTIYQSQN